MRSWLLALVSCVSAFDAAPEPSLPEAKAGLLTDPAAPIVVQFSEPIKPETLTLTIAKNETDDHARLPDERDPPAPLSILFSHSVVDGDIGGSATFSPDGRTFTINAPMPISPTLVLLVAPGLTDLGGIATVARRKITFGYDFKLTCTAPTTFPKSGKYFFVANITLPIATQVRLFAEIKAKPETGAWNGSFIRAGRNPDPNRCNPACDPTLACRTLGVSTPVCVPFSERAASPDEYPDFLVDAASPASYRFNMTGCVVDQKDGTIAFTNVPVDINVTQPVVTLRNGKISASFANDTASIFRGKGSLTADEVLLGTQPNGAGVGDFQGRILPADLLLPDLPSPPDP